MRGIVQERALLPKLQVSTHFYTIFTWEGPKRHIWRATLETSTQFQQLEKWKDTQNKQGPFPTKTSNNNLPTKQVLQFLLSLVLLPTKQDKTPRKLLWTFELKLNILLLCGQVNTFSGLPWTWLLYYWRNYWSDFESNPPTCLLSACGWLLTNPFGSGGTLLAICLLRVRTSNFAHLPSIVLPGYLVVQTGEPKGIRLYPLWTVWLLNPHLNFLGFLFFILPKPEIFEKPALLLICEVSIITFGVEW